MPPSLVLGGDGGNADRTARTPGNLVEGHLKRTSVLNVAEVMPAPCTKSQTASPSFWREEEGQSRGGGHLNRVK